MSMTVGDFIVKRLHDWGVRRIFRYPGDGINAVFVALDRAKESLEFIQTRHEEMAAFMASAHTKFTGELGVCIATSGPGASHLVTGLYDARLDHQPVLAITGQQAGGAIGGHYQREVDLVSLSRMSPAISSIRRAYRRRSSIWSTVRIALANRTVTALILPDDLQEMPYEEPPRLHGTIHSGIGFRPPKTIPHADDLKQAADILNAGKKVAILVGAGALGAADEVIAVADRLGAGAAKALLGKAVLPDDLPWVTGSIGMQGTKPSWKLMTGCDTLLMIGSGFPYSEFLPEEASQGDADLHQSQHAVAALSDGRQPRRRRRRDAKALLPLLEQKKDHWRKEIAVRSRTGGRRSMNERRRKPIPSIRSESHGNCRHVRRKAASSPAIPVPVPTGMPATSRYGAA